MISASFFALGVLVGMLACLEVGRRIGLARRARDPEGADAGTGGIDGALYGLFSLLLAFTFNGAADRFESRRQLVGEEANAIGTAYLLIDMLPSETQGPLKAELREYVDSRITTFQKLPDIPAARDEIARSQALQERIWVDAVAAQRLPNAPPPQVVLPAINQMFDVAQAHLVATTMHPPLVIFLMLGTLALVSALLAGYTLGAVKKRQILHVVLFTAMLAGTAYVIVDIEYPLLGLIRDTSSEQILVGLRKTMK